MKEKKLDFIIDIPKKINNIFFLLHGFGSDNEDIMPVGMYFREILPTTIMISVNAPEVSDMNVGYQWFSFKTNNVDSILKEIKYSYFLLNNLIDEKLKEFNLKDENLLIGGFSQGAMMSLYTGIRRKETPMGILSFSGILPDTMESLNKDLVSHPEVLLLHGTDDKVLPFESMRNAEKLLREFDVPCETHQIQDMDHTINNEALEYAKKFIMRICNKTY